MDSFSEEISCALAVVFVQVKLLSKGYRFEFHHLSRNAVQFVSKLVKWGLEERLAKLAGGVAVVHVGAPSEQS